jgi:hypothetical protein
MLREDMVECAALVGRALVLCQYGHGDDAAGPLEEALELLQKAPDVQRQKWRDRKQAQRERESTDVTGTSRDVTVTGCDVTGDSVEEEEGVEEEAPTPPPFIVPSVSMDDVDAVLAGFNEITGSSLRTGDTRSKKAASTVRSILVRLTKEEGDVEAARRRLGRVVMWLWKERAGGDFAKFVVPSTVCSPSKFDSYEEQMGVPTNGTANGMTRASFDDAVAACDACRWTKIDFPHRVHCQQHSRLLRDGEVSA